MITNASFRTKKLPGELLFKFILLIYKNKLIYPLTKEHLLMKFLIECIICLIFYLIFL